MGNHIPRGFQRARNFQLARDHVDGAERHDADADPAQSVGRAGNAGDNLVHGAVAARGDDGVETIGHRGGGEARGFSGAGRGAERAVGREVAEVRAEVPGFVAARGGIEDDAGGHGGWRDGGFVRHGGKPNARAAGTAAVRVGKWDYPTSSRIGVMPESTRYCGRPVGSLIVAVAVSMPRQW